jgi:hypothetical protein
MRTVYIEYKGLKESAGTSEGGPRGWTQEYAAKPLKGYWFDRTQEYAARNRGEDFGRLTYATEKTFFLSRLPCWEHLSPEALARHLSPLPVFNFPLSLYAIQRQLLYQRLISA